MRRLAGKFVFLVWAALCVFADRTYCQTGPGETLSGPDSHETVKAHMGISSETGAVSGRAC